MNDPILENSAYDSACALEPADLPDRGRAGLFAGLSFVCGILGFGALPILGTIGAIVFGRKARAQNRAPNDSATVTFFAGAGLIFGFLQVFTVIAGIGIALFLWALFGLSALTS